MKKFLPLAFLVLLLSRLPFLYSIKCTNCFLRPPGHACSKPSRPCFLKQGDSCFRQTVYFGLVPLYSRLGCIRDCITFREKKEKLKITETFFCCSNENYCNA